MTGNTIHGSCVAFDDIGVLLRGPSGAGKSDLALRLIDAGARLVADDRVRPHKASDKVLACAPSEIAGLLEIRGSVIHRFPHVGKAALRLVCDLVDGDCTERLPEPRWCAYLGVRICLVDIAPFAVSAAVRLLAAAYAAAGRLDPVTGAIPVNIPGYSDTGER